MKKLMVSISALTMVMSVSAYAADGADKVISAKALKTHTKIRMRSGPPSSYSAALGRDVGLGDSTTWASPLQRSEWDSHVKAYHAYQATLPDHTTTGVSK